MEEEGLRCSVHLYQKYSIKGLEFTLENVTTFTDFSNVFS